LHKNNPNIDKQIKVFHFCEGMSHRKAQQIIDIANKFWHNYFNEETKKFLKTQCNCK